MENASKALIIAGSFLIGMIIISIAVVLFSSFGNTGSEIMTKIEESQITQWNNTILKYYGYIENPDGQSYPIPITAHDIISLASFARDTNIKNEFNVDVLDKTSPDFDKADGGSLYLQVDVADNGVNINNIEKRIGKPYPLDTSNELFEEYFIKNNEIYPKPTNLHTGDEKSFTKCYKIAEMPEFGEGSKRVTHAKITEFSKEDYKAYYYTIMEDLTDGYFE